MIKIALKSDHARITMFVLLIGAFVKHNYNLYMENIIMLTKRALYDPLGFCSTVSYKSG